jgi:hypothetical protein
VCSASLFRQLIICGCFEEVGPFPQLDQRHSLHGALTTGRTTEQDLEDEFKKIK